MSKSKKYIIAHDIGTSSDKAVLVDFEGNIVGTYTSHYETYYPYPAWAEQVPDDYWNAVVITTRGLLTKFKIDPEDIKGIIFSTQAMGVIPVDSDGNVLYNNITWVDGRAEKQATRLMNRMGGKRAFTMLAGTPIMGKDVVAKIVWVKEERPDIYEKTKYFLDVNGYLKYKCTGKMVAELSGASSYGLNKKKNKWLGSLKLLGIDMDKLPPLVKSTDKVGSLTKEAAEQLGLPRKTPVFGGCDDVQSASIGSGMVDEGDIHIYLGTSAWVCCVSSKDKFINGAAAIKSADPTLNLIAGITEAAGSNIEWIINEFFRHEKETEQEKIFEYLDKAIKEVPPGSEHLICTPWMLGERCPVSSTTTRATLFNINPEHKKEHMLRALYEGIAFNLRWILENFTNDYGFECSKYRIIGGGSLNDTWMQIIADITNAEFSVPVDPRNAGAKGAAIIALIGLGELKSFAEAKTFVKLDRTYRPSLTNKKIYDKLFNDYKNVYHSLEKAYNIANSSRFEGDE